LLSRNCDTAKGSPSAERTENATSVMKATVSQASMVVGAPSGAICVYSSAVPSAAPVTRNIDTSLP